MKTYSLPAEIDVLIFDIDNTLYRNDEYCELQVELLIDRFADFKGLGAREARGLISSRKAAYLESHNGGTTSTGNIMLDLGVSIEENARWRNELFNPESYLEKDPATVEAIGLLEKSFILAAVTNNTVELGRRTLSRLGLESFFRELIGLDTCYVSKPARAPYIEALRRVSAPAGRGVSIGDRYDVDLAIPIEMGMGGILIEKLDELGDLPEILAGRNQKL